MNVCADPSQCLEIQQELNRARRNEREEQYKLSVLKLARSTFEFHRLPEHAKDRLDEELDEADWKHAMARLSVQRLEARLAEVAGFGQE